MSVVEAPGVATAAARQAPDTGSTSYLCPPLELRSSHAPSPPKSPAGSTPSNDTEHEDEAQVMERLYEARRRLDAANDDMRDDSWLTPASMLLPSHQSTSSLMSPSYRAQSPIARPTYAQQSSAPSPPVALPDHLKRNTSRRVPSLTLDLKDLPYTALIDAERRRLSESSTDLQQTNLSPAKDIPSDAAGAAAAANDISAEEAAAPVPSINSGSRYGIAPFMDLERGEWVWYCDAKHMSPHPPDGREPQAMPNETVTPTSSTKLTHAAEEWAWAVHGSAPMTQALD